MQQGALARLLPSAVRVRIRSRSTSASPPSTASIKRLVLVPVSAHGSASDRNCPPAFTIRLAIDDGEQIERAARQPVDARHRHYVARGEAVEHAGKLGPVGPRARHLLAVDVPAAASGSAKLVKLGIERLPIGADAGIADKVFFGVSFGHILRQP
jgi:hypothetical protein